MKNVIFLGSSRSDLRNFPQPARQQAGFEIYGVQHGEEPTDWKPLKTIGPGVKELRIHRKGEHRVIYVAKFREAVYVLHAFQKKTQKTPKRDLALAKSRYEALIKER